MAKSGSLKRKQDRTNDHHQSSLVPGEESRPTSATVTAESLGTRSGESNSDSASLIVP